MPRSILWVLFIAVATAGLGLAFAGTPESNSERVKKLAADGAALIASEGIEKACKMLRVRNGPYFQGEYYVFVFDFTGVWRCYPPHPEAEGQSIIDLRDSDGRPLVRDMISLAKERGEGWLDYRWTDPVTSKIELKSTFVKRVPGAELLAASGYYH
ncbi:cache domain-containing protein [Bradyrhizobium jicamae]|uniref:Cache domain-containing protein n=1 Tax=Bradyrhizobium jicamae TaxID=280332 RepID=A0ABS5FXQ5_9BRAD|nr:cache domain-containing protein [Bradyrhizobium jicamae]MBR0801605.1 cache domain-containing protein [Bradyrhizobium jicamae]